MIKLNISTENWVNNSIRVELANSYDCIFVSSKHPIEHKVKEFEYELDPLGYNLYDVQGELAMKLKMKYESHHIEHLMEVITSMVLCWKMGYNRGTSAGREEMRQSVITHGL